MDYLPVENVQALLDTLTPDQPFAVTFNKANGESRTLEGRLIPSDKPKQSIVAIELIGYEGIRSFNIHKVTELGLI
jgi:hypothetical protein